MPLPTHTYGTVLQVDGNGDGTYEDVAEVIDITGPEVGTSDVKTTHLNSTDAAHEYIPGLIEGGEISFTLRFHRTQFNTLYGYIRTTKPWKIKFPLITGETSNSTWTASGHINKIGTEMPEDDKIVAPVTVKVTGKPAFTAGS